LRVTSSGDLLVSDASDPIIVATATDFCPGRFANAIPEPPTALLLLMAPAVAHLRTRRIRIAAATGHAYGAVGSASEVS